MSSNILLRNHAMIPLKEEKKNIPGSIHGTDTERLRCDVCMCMLALLQLYLPEFECACMYCYAFVCNVGKES